MNYLFDNFKVDTSNFKLEKDGNDIAIEPQVFDLLVYLIAHRNRLVTRQEIFDTIWGGREVSDTSLSNHIKSARKAVGDDGRRQQIIKTTHGRGYQFISQVSEDCISVVQLEGDSAAELNSIELNRSELNSIENSDGASGAANTLPETNINYRQRYKVAVGILLLLIILFSVVQLNSWFDKPGDQNKIHRIAVLPFSNTRPELETDYIGFAIADQIIGEMAYLKGIAVRPSSSIRQYAQKVYDSVEVGKTLGVDFVLSGSYLKEDNNIRLNIELLEIESSQLLWRGKQIEVDYKNAFLLQDIVAEKVIDRLNIQFGEQELSRIKKDVSDDPLAYEYYFRSISYPQTAEGNLLAVEMLKKSIALDDRFAPAYVQLGNRLRRLQQYGLFDTNTPQSAESYYLKALALNPELIAALSYLAMYYTETNRIDQAVLLARKMLEINSDSASAHFTLGYIYRYAGVVELAIKEMEKAVAIDPENPGFRSLIGAYSGTGQYHKALKTLENYPESPFTHGWQGLMYRRLGEKESALKSFNEVIANDPEGLWGQVATIHKSYMLGDFDPGLKAIKKLEKTNVVDAETTYYLAAYYGLLNERQSCLKALRKAVESGYFNDTFINNASHFDSVRAEPEFGSLLILARKKRLAFQNKHF